MMNAVIYTGIDYQAKVRMRRELNINRQFNNPNPELELLLEAVCKHQNIKVAHVKGKSRLFEVKVARFYYCYIARLLSDYSLDKIGALVGRHHATVLHANNTVKDWLAYDKQVINDIEEIESKIKGVN